MNSWLDFLPGKKTYIVALGAVLVSAGMWLTGDLAFAEALQNIITAILGATIRKSIK